METVRRNFLRRQRGIRKKHRKMAAGYVTTVNKAGVIEHHPRKSVSGFSVRPFVILALVFTAFKISVIVKLGEAEYLKRLEALGAGDTVDVIGAFVMQIDPVTRGVLSLLNGTG
ncbi:hypothetical protein FIU97_01980 [Roseivivax sp. THAF40]|uniref:hypothetical protein n=1 Tax=unclassified Roseivivax TaxID=2639302 RepID=UPI001268FDAE|nr:MULTISPECIES: hypothetical protein [unclassified Roseivivax]QFS81604.1 hypothetical protein FIV09_02075 [Roseivivax sp. THAF197b]QFT45333.1 hypothetical protein FIU97_01980 [Roseivivax sp. THAF40]